MDRKEMSSLDLRFLMKELREQLVGGRVRKIYQYEKKQFLFEFHLSGAGARSLYVDNSKLFLTQHKLPSPPAPPSFCMFLRKHLMGKMVRSISQYLFDRIIEIKFPDNVLILELIPPGNVILCDADYTIIMPLEIQKWRDRVVKPRNFYQHPPLQKDPFSLSLEELQQLLGKSSKNLGSFLATTLGLGGVYGKEICYRAGISEATLAKEIGLEGASTLHSVLESLEKESSPTRYEDVVSPFPLKSRGEGQEYPSFSQALDEFFIEQVVAQEKKEEGVQKEKERIERILHVQEEATEKFTEQRGEKKEIAERIYQHYSLVEGVLEGMRKAKERGLSWEEVKEKVRREGSEEAEAIKDIREKEAMVVVDLGGKEVELDFRLSVEENAARYFEASKLARKKLERVAEAREEKEKELEQVPRVQEEKKVIKKPRAKWYEKFRWFVSSDGFLVIGGKDAKQNEMIYSKYLKPGDKVFHAAIQGASLVAIQSEGREASEEAKREAAEFSAAHSKAWSKGLGAIDIFAVDPEQVSKSPPSGMFLPKGSFAIAGERKWYRNTEVKLAVGVLLDREKGFVKVVTGPVLAMRKNADYFITIKPGFKKSLELARSIKNKLLLRASPEDCSLVEGLPLEDIQKRIPSGMGEIVEYG